MWISNLSEALPLPDKLSESKALKSLQDFIEDQEANPIVPQRDNNPDANPMTTVNDPYNLS